MLIIEEGADGESGAASSAAGGMLGHNDPVARVMQANDGHSGPIRHSNKNMATRASDSRTKPN